MGNIGPHMSEAELDDLNMVYLTEKRQFIFSGIYPLRSYTIFYLARTIILCFFSTLLTLSMITTLAMGVNDISQITGILYSLMAFITYIWKLITLIAGRDKILAIEDHLRQPVFYKYLRKYGTEFLKEDVFFITLLVYVFRVSVLVMVTFYGIFPLLDKDPDKNLPFPGWFPVDKNKYRAPLYVLQLCCLFVCAGTNSSIDIITSKMIIIAVVMLKTLKRCLNAIDYTDDAGSDIISSDLEVIVILHENILQYLIMLEDLISSGVFFQFLVYIVVLCFTGFQMLVIPVGSAQFLLMVSFSVVIMSQVSLYCWYGNKILSEKWLMSIMLGNWMNGLAAYMEHTHSVGLGLRGPGGIMTLRSDGIINACYMSNWYEGTTKAKKVLFMIMEKSKREVKLTAGKMFTLSLATLILIFKSSYSYFVVLQRVFKEA